MRLRGFLHTPLCCGWFRVSCHNCGRQTLEGKEDSFQKMTMSWQINIKTILKVFPFPALMFWAWQLQWGSVSLCVWGICVYVCALHYKHTADHRRPCFTEASTQRPDWEDSTDLQSLISLHLPHLPIWHSRLPTAHFLTLLGPTLVAVRCCLMVKPWSYTAHDNRWFFWYAHILH